MSAVSSRLVDLLEAAPDVSTVDAMNPSSPFGSLSDLSERELLTELVLIEDQIRERLPADETWPREPGAEAELLALFLRERAVSRHLHAERAAMSSATRYA